MSELQLPNIPIKILRRGNRIQLKCGDYQLELKEIYQDSQTYSLLLLDKFITEVTTIMLKKEMEKQSNRQAVKESLGIDSEIATDNVIRQIHEEIFGDQQ